MNASKNLDNNPQQWLPPSNDAFQHRRLQARQNAQYEGGEPMQETIHSPTRSPRPGESTYWPHRRSESPRPFSALAQDERPIRTKIPRIGLIMPTPPQHPPPRLPRGRSAKNVRQPLSSSLSSPDGYSIWQAVVEQAAQRDAELVDGWQRSMDVLLIFAALFASILTAFLIESTKELKNNYREETVLLLEQIARSLNSSFSDGVPSDSVKPTSAAHLVNRLWYSSLALTLASAVGAMVAKQWLSEYTTDLTFESRRHASRERFQREAHLREFRYSGLTRWHVPEFIGFLPIVLHFALLLFWAGLIEYLWGLDLYSSILALGISGALFTSYIVSMILPSIFTGCPYKTPIAHLIANGTRAFWIILNRWPTKSTLDPNDPSDEKKTLQLRDALGVNRVLWEEENNEIERLASELDEECLERLKETTRSESTAAWATEHIEELLWRRTPHRPGPQAGPGDYGSNRTVNNNTPHEALGGGVDAGNTNPILPNGAVAIDMGHRR